MAADFLDKLGVAMAVLSLAMLGEAGAAAYLGLVLAREYLVDNLGWALPLLAVVPGLLLALAAVTACVGVYGLCAGTGRNRAHLLIFAALVTLLCAAYLALAALLCEARMDVAAQVFLRADVESFAKEYSSDEEAKGVWDTIQSGYVCCGGHGAHDGYEIWANAGLPSHSLPNSCCKETPDCGRAIFQRVRRQNLHLHVFTRGCMAVVQDALDADVSPLLALSAGGALAAAAFKAAAAFLACTAAREIDVGSDYRLPTDEELAALGSKAGNGQAESAATNMSSALEEETSTGTL